MEIWIVGGALVALMVYVSTRIKKSAAEAFDRETIETDLFFFIKPKGFICPSDRLAVDSFYAHSQAFGDTEATEVVYQAEAVLERFDRSFDEIKAETLSLGNFAVEEVAAQELILRGLVTEGGIEYKIFRKIIQSSEKSVFVLTVRVLCGNLDEFGSKADEIVSGFSLK